MDSEYLTEIMTGQGRVCLLAVVHCRHLLGTVSWAGFRSCSISDYLQKTAKLDRKNARKITSL